MKESGDHIALVTCLLFLGLELRTPNLLVLFPYMTIICMLSEWFIDFSDLKQLIFFF